MTGKSVRIVVSLMLALGLAAGAARADQDEGWQALQSKLRLTAPQIEKLKPLFAEFRDQRMAVRKAFRANVNRILRPDQQARLQELTAAQEHPAAHTRSLHRRLLDELNLTPEQRAQIEQFGREKVAQLQTYESRFTQRLRSFLTSEQVDGFARLLKQHESHFAK